MKWEPRNNYPELVKAQFIDIPPRAKAGDEAEEVWFFGEQNNHAPAQLLCHLSVLHPRGS